MTDPAAATLAALRAKLRSFAQQPTPDWDALIAEQDAWQAAHPEPARYAAPPTLATPPTAATAMPARALRHQKCETGLKAPWAP